CRSSELGGVADVARHQQTVVVNLLNSSPSCAGEALMELGGILGSARLIIVLSLRTLRMRDVNFLSTHCPHAEVVINGIDSLGRMVQMGARHNAEQGYTQILTPLAPVYAEPMRSIVARAVLVARRRIAVAAFAAQCGIAPRTLEVRCKCGGAPEPRALLGWILSLHVVWRLDML